MTEIKLIKLFPRRGGTALVVSTEPEPLVISTVSALERRLIAGTVITSAQLEQLREESELFLCSRKATDLLAMRDHSVGELRTKLKRKGFSNRSIDPVLQKHISQGTLDDARFANMAAESLIIRRPCGKSYLIAYLQKKRISRDIAEQTAGMLLAENSETDRAVQALQARWNRLSQFELETARKKAYNYLSRRGFGYGAAKEAFDVLLSEQEHEGPDY